MRGVIIPRTYVEEINNPLIFLAGQIRGTPNWQDEAIKLLFSKNSDLVIASPRRGVREGIATYVIQGEDYFPRQRAWERHYLGISSKKGSILFWLPGEENHDCNKVYGAMTRLELGQCLANYRHDSSVRFCIGSDGNFPEMSTISYDLQLDAPDKEVFSSPEKTCTEAIRLALQ